MNFSDRASSRASIQSASKYDTVSGDDLFNSFMSVYMSVRGEEQQSAKLVPPGVSSVVRKPPLTDLGNQKNYINVLDNHTDYSTVFVEGSASNGLLASSEQEPLSALRESNSNIDPLKGDVTYADISILSLATGQYVPSTHGHSASQSEVNGGEAVGSQSWQAVVANQLPGAAKRSADYENLEPFGAERPNEYEEINGFASLHVVDNLSTETSCENSMKIQSLPHAGIPSSQTNSRGGLRPCSLQISESPGRGWTKSFSSPQSQGQHGSSVVRELYYGDERRSSEFHPLDNVFEAIDVRGSEYASNVKGAHLPEAGPPGTYRSTKENAFRLSTCEESTSLPSSSTPTLRKESSDVVCSGFMFKQGGSGFTPKNWRWRWFALKQDSCLYYYKNQKDRAPNGAVMLLKYSVARAPEVNKKWAFKLVKGGARTYFFAAASEEEMRRWMRVLAEAGKVALSDHTHIPECSLKNVSIPALSLSKPDCHGFLYKQGNSHKSWRRRYCVLKFGCLFYYEDIQDQSAIGVFKLHNYEINRSVHTRNGFKATPPRPDMRTYYFYAETDKDMERWMGAMRSSLLHFQ